jgi:hypothetical protein
MTYMTETGKVGGRSVQSSDSNKIIPKLCTAINFGILKNKNVVMSLAYNQDKNGPLTLIERVVMDIEHAKKVVVALQEIITKSEVLENKK